MVEKWSNGNIINQEKLNAIIKNVEEIGIVSYAPDNQSGAIKFVDGSVVAEQFAVYSVINVEKVKQVSFLSTAFANQYGYAFFDENDTFINGSGHHQDMEGELMLYVPSNAKTLKITSHTDTEQVVTLHYEDSNFYSISDEIQGISRKVFENKREVDLKKYDPINGIISTANGSYVRYNTSNHIFIPVSELGDSVKLIANENIDTNFCFLKTVNGNIGDKADFAGSYTSALTLLKGQSVTKHVPDDAGFLYVSYLIDNNTTNTISLPEKILTMNYPYITIAASDSRDADKEKADYVCTGTNDELIINMAVSLLKYGGTIQLFDGNYYIDSFSQTKNSAIYFDRYLSKGKFYARTITIKGTTENKSFLSRYGAALHVTKTAYDSMQDGSNYNVFMGSDALIPIGDWHGFANNVNYENFYLFLYDSSKSITGINARNLGSVYFNQVGVYSEQYFEDRFNHRKPATPNNKCIGVISPQSANDEMARLGMTCLNVGGLHTGIILSGVEHLILKTCTVSRCVYGYVFAGPMTKPITLINCADEGNAHFPSFSDSGIISAIDFSFERLNADVIPDDPDGNLERRSIEATPSGWHGDISYSVEGYAFGIGSFWASGSGNNVKTTNLRSDTSGQTVPKDPNYLQRYYKTDIGKEIIWNGNNWIDLLGNIIA